MEQHNPCPCWDKPDIDWAASTHNLADCKYTGSPFEDEDPDAVRSRTQVPKALMETKIILANTQT